MKERSQITLEHGSGSRAARELVRELMLARFKNAYLARLADAAVFKNKGGRFAFTADSYVVSPLFFPGGDIGKLAVCGTINDLVVMGAQPLYLSCSLIIEEKLDFRILERIVSSLGKWAGRCGVAIVTGDTKVVEEGNADQLYINTAGIGVIPEGLSLSPSRIRPGDSVIVSGTVGDHGLSILAAREGLEIGPQLKSDCAPLNGLVNRMLRSGAEVKFMRDPTRGGVAAVLNELAEGKRWGIRLSEAEIPLRPKVKAALEILGLDPLTLANEGKLLAVASGKDAPKLLEAMRNDPAGRKARIIGEVVATPPGLVCIGTLSGGLRTVDWPRGEQLPRIC